MNNLKPIKVALASPITPLTYLAPIGILPGIRIKVTLRNRIASGIVIGPDLNPPKIALKSINQILDPFPLLPEKLWQLIQFTAKYYGCSLANLITLCIPWTLVANIESLTPGGNSLKQLIQDNLWHELAIIGKNWNKNTKLLQTLFNQKNLRSAGRIELHLNHKTQKLKLTKKQSRAIDILKLAGGHIFQDTLQNKFHISLTLIKQLSQLNIIERTKRLDLDTDLAPINKNYQDDKQTVLSTNQKRIADQVCFNEFTTYLLYGITGSGKTEIYLKLAERILKIGKRVLWLVPEIGLTPKLLKRLENKFPKQVAVYHAGLSTSEKRTNIIRVLQQQTSILVGVRNAILAPLQNIGLIIVDEEHESSYKSSEYPYINARDLAIKRAQLEKCPVILGSATPSLETWYSAHKGQYKLLRLMERPSGMQLPKVQIIDLKESYQEEHKRISFSPILINAIKENLLNREQSMLLLNRRGFQNFFMCRVCGTTINCPHCSLTLTHHRSTNNLRCHLCDFQQQKPQRCDVCKNQYLRGVGEGTEQIEEKIKNLFPNARILRLDRDTTKQKGKLESGLLSVEKGEIDILIGTQMLAKGHNFPMLSLVGILNADLGLRLTDFRAGEHTFQLLTQVAGRAGRFHIPGRVILQTYNPEHPAITYAMQQNFDNFVTDELKYRNMLGYPPYSAISLYKSYGKTPEHASAPLKQIKIQLQSINGLRILGPIEAPIAKIKDKYHMQLIVKAKNKKILSDIMTIVNIEQNHYVTIDRDPINFGT